MAMWPEFGIKSSHGSFYLETNIYQNSPKKLSNVCATLVRIIIDKNIQNGHTGRESCYFIRERKI